MIQRAEAGQWVPFIWRNMTQFVTAFTDWCYSVCYWLGACNHWIYGACTTLAGALTNYIIHKCMVCLSLRYSIFLEMPSPSIFPVLNKGPFQTLHLPWSLPWLPHWVLLPCFWTSVTLCGSMPCPALHWITVAGILNSALFLREVHSQYFSPAPWAFFPLDLVDLPPLPHRDGAVSLSPPPQPSDLPVHTAEMPCSTVQEKPWFGRWAWGCWQYLSMYSRPILKLRVKRLTIATHPDQDFPSRFYQQTKLVSSSVWILTSQLFSNSSTEKEGFLLAYSNSNHKDILFLESSAALSKVHSLYRQVLKNIIE